MPFKTIEKLTGGLNELANPDTLPPDVLRQCVNFEILGDGNLTRRMQEAEFGADVSGDSLNDVLTDAVTGVLQTSVTQVSPPYYPVKKLSDQSGDYILLVYGETSDGDFYLYMCYENTSNTWTATKVDIDGIEYTINTYLEFFVGDDKMIITDTYHETLNFPHYVKVDPLGDLITGLFSIQSPANKPVLTPTTAFDPSDFEEDTTAQNAGECGLIQCLYTVVTEEGDESNPSPMSITKMAQFFKKDLTDFNDERWLDSFRIDNLSVPDLTGDLIEQLKYFYVYFRIIRYSEGDDAAPFYFSQRFEIVDKTAVDSTLGTTGNGYIVTVPVDNSIQVSYENDIAPYAKHAAEVSGIVGFANIREKTRFPHQFEKYSTITINNVNNKNFVDGLFQIRLYGKQADGKLDADGVQVDYIEDLDIERYTNGSTGYIANENEIRIYDDDLTTPLRVGYIEALGGYYIDLFIKVPLVFAGQVKTLYVAFNTEDADTDDIGVPSTVATYQSAEYGEFTKISATNLQDFFDSERVKSAQTIICSPMDYQENTGEIINLADDNAPGEIILGDDDEGGFVDTRTTTHFLTEMAMSVGKFESKSNASNGTNLSELRYSNLPFSAIPQKTTMWARLEYFNLDQAEDRPIMMLRDDAATDHHAIYLSVYEYRGEYRWGVFASTAVDTGGRIGRAMFDDIPISDTAQGEVFVCLSIDYENKMSLFVAVLGTKNYYTQELTWDRWEMTVPADSAPDEEYLTDIGMFSIGNNGHDSGLDSHGAGFLMYTTQLQVLINRYYSGIDHNDKTAMWNVASYMPSFENAIGIKLLND